MTQHPTRLRPPSRALGLALVLGLCLPACETPSPGTTKEIRGDLDRLERRQPADVAVAPVRDRTGRDTVPRELVRTAFEEALVERLYSPLDSEYVDRNWIDTSFRGTPSPDALMLVVIETYDPSRLYSSGRVTLGGEVVLFEGADTTGAVLWSRAVREEIDLSRGRGGPPTPSETHIPEAVRRFAARALAQLPERDPVAAHDGSSTP